MTKTNRWINGCAALLIGGAASAFAAPPQPQGRSDDRTDTEQIFENAKDRAAERGNRAAEETTPDAQDRNGQAGADQGINPDKNGTDAGDEALRAERRDQAAGRKLAADESHAGRLPEGFDRLGLTDREKAAMLRVIAQYDRQSEDLLKRFEQLHAQAIGIEAIALAESARQNGGSILTAQDSDQARKTRQEQPEGRRTAGFRGGDAARQHGKSSDESGAANADDQPAEEIKELAESSPFAGPSADIWKKLHKLHLEAVKVEAQKLAAIEKLLSPEQLEQLHQFRAESRAKQGRQTSGEDRPDRPDLQNSDQNAEEERRDRQSDRAAGSGGAEGREGRIDPNRSQQPLPERRGPGED